MSLAHIITLPIKEVEQKLNIEIKRNSISLGLDCASKTGYAICKTDKEYIYISIGFINVDVSNIKDKEERNHFRYNAIYDSLNNLIKSEYTVVIEDVYYGGNVFTLILLSRIGAIAWTTSKIKECKDIIWKTAVQARKSLGLPCNKKKIIVKEALNMILGTTIENDDEIDAIILGINGLIKF